VSEESGTGASFRNSLPSPIFPDFPHSCPRFSWLVFLDRTRFADSPHSILGEDTTDDDTPCTSD
jgi:hypothetical protein